MIKLLIVLAMVALLLWSGPHPTAAGQVACQDDTWSAPQFVAFPPLAQTGLSTLAGIVVSAGSQVFVWGTDPSGGAVAYIASYPDLNFRSCSMVGAPSPRLVPLVLWTGTAVAILGGGSAGDPTLQDGALYDPMSDSWTPINTVGMPTLAGAYAFLLWTGSDLLLWTSSGIALYDPTVGSSWQSITTPEIPLVVIDQAAATMVGQKLLAFFVGVTKRGVSRIVGLTYDTATNVWGTASTLGFPVRSVLPALVWTGTVALLIDNSGIGGRYDPVTDSWADIGVAPTSIQYALGTGLQYSQEWTGEDMVVFNPFFGGGRYDPLTDSWRSVSPPDEPSTGPDPPYFAGEVGSTVVAIIPAGETLQASVQSYCSQPSEPPPIPTVSVVTAQAKNLIVSGANLNQGVVLVNGIPQRTVSQPNGLVARKSLNGIAHGQTVQVQVIIAPNGLESASTPFTRP